MGQGHLSKGAFWCPCFAFAQTGVRLAVPCMSRGWHENSTRYLQAKFAVSDTPAAVLGSSGLGQTCCPAALGAAGAGGAAQPPAISPVLVPNTAGAHRVLFTPRGPRDSY